MANPDKPFWIVRVARWVRSYPADTVTIVIILVTIALAVLQIFYELPPAWIISAIAALAAAAALLLIINHQLNSRFAAEISGLKDGIARVLPNDHLQQVDPMMIDDELILQLDVAASWHFRGASARWQRSHVLPRLGQIADRDVVYSAQVLNPFDANVCQKYAEYRFRQRGGKGDAPSGVIVQRDLMAFIYALAWFEQNKRLQPSVTLLQTYSPLRFDLSDRAVIVTSPNLKAPGLRATSDSWYYRSLVDENHQSVQILATLKLPEKQKIDSTGVAAQAYFEQVLTLNKSVKPATLAKFDADYWDNVAKIAFEATK